MNRKTVIRKLLLIGAWLLVIAGMATLLIAANAKKEERVCSRVVVTIKGTGEKFYIDETDIRRQIEKAGGQLVGRPLSQIRLSALEKMLAGDQWIRKAELYFDKDQALHVFAEEREPIARVFARNGATFYMDSSGHRMPLLQKMSIRVPVITGFANSVRTAKDSALLEGVKKLAWFVYSHPFWSAQTGQIDITPDGKFELIPVVGTGVVRLGNAENLEDKFHRLEIFYKQVLRKVGFHKYAVVDAQFAGQIVGVHKGTISTVDSLQLHKNIEELLQRSTIRNLSEEMMPMADTKDSVKKNTALYSGADTLSSPIPTRDTVRQKPATDAAKTNRAMVAPVVKSNPIAAKSAAIQPKKNGQPKVVAKKTVQPKAVRKKPAAPDNQY